LILQTNHDVRTTSPNHSTPAPNDKTQATPTATGIDSMLGSTILTAENDRSNSQAHEVATPNATTTNSKNNRVVTLNLKGLLLLLYFPLCGWILCLCLLLVVTLYSDQSLLDVCQYVFRDVAGFRNWFIAPVLLWGLMTRFYYLRA
jgi:hypothetical protein